MSVHDMLRHRENIAGRFPELGPQAHLHAKAYTPRDGGMFLMLTVGTPDDHLSAGVKVPDDVATSPSAMERWVDEQLQRLVDEFCSLAHRLHMLGCPELAALYGYRRAA